MPLLKGYSRSTISENIRELTHTREARFGRKLTPRERKQVVAIALSSAKRSVGKRGVRPHYLQRKRRARHRSTR
jgi:hypothetical protein